MDIGLSFCKCAHNSLLGFTDAERAPNIGYCKSTGGRDNLVSWSSKKQAVVARLSTESEYGAIANGATELVWIESLLQETGHTELKSLLVLWCDNLSASSLASNTVLHARMEHIEVDVVKDKVVTKKLKIRYVPSSYQVADILTKNLSTSWFLTLLRQTEFVFLTFYFVGLLDNVR